VSGLLAPPYARRWALGRPAEELLNDPQADTAWVPEEALPPVTWTEQDVRALRLIGGGLGSFQVLKVINEENHVTDQTAPEGFTGQDDDGGWGEATGKTPPVAAYPEHQYKLADHVYTWSPKLPDGSMLVIRAQSADALVEAVEAVAPLAGRLRAAWQAVTGAPQAPAQQAPQGPVPFPQGVNYNPQTPPPNQPFPGQPAWQQAGAPQAPQQPWGGAPQGASVPPGWYKLTVPFPQKSAFDAIVSQYSLTKGDPTRGGQVSWQKAVKSWYCSPEVAQLFGQFNPVAA
jgi:hypothetical protein